MPLFNRENPVTISSLSVLPIASAFGAGTAQISTSAYHIDLSSNGVEWYNRGSSSLLADRPSATLFGKGEWTVGGIDKYLCDGNNWIPLSGSLVIDSAIAAWGDSLTSGDPGSKYPDILANQINQIVYNGGVGGETSTQIKARFLADPEKWGLPTIIWAGRNNLESPATVKADIAEMVAALTTDKYLILSIPNGNYAIEYKGQADYVTLIQLNNYLAATYGNHYIDIRTYMVNQYDPNQAQDVIDFGNDITPTSLRSDSLHFNPAGRALVVNKILQNFTELFSTVGNGYKYSGSYINYPNIVQTGLPPLSNELLDTTNWTSTGWTGGFTAGFTHTAGNTTALTNTLSATASIRYRATFTVTGRTAGSFTITFGSVTSAAYTATGEFNTGTAATGTLSITPTTDFNGTIVVSLRRLYDSSQGVMKLVDSSGNNVFSLRANISSCNLFAGTLSGGYATTGSGLTGFGYASLQDATTASSSCGIGQYAAQHITTSANVTAVGASALRNLTTGSNTTAFGAGAYQNITTTSSGCAFGSGCLGSSTSSSLNNGFGAYALAGLTTGNHCVGFGYNAGRYLTDGSTANTGSTTSIFIGDSTKAKAGSGTNEIVIGDSATGNGSNTATLGNSSVTDTYLGGTTHAGKFQLNALNTAPASSTDTGIAGEIRITANYIYICTATNVWVRAALSSF